ncbi:MAG: 50S ribosomal protein L9 [Oscillospiraceae bacterium]|nr:50S ribosomal protein L9 [Oscillospiraceae bacterium]
MKVVLKQDVKGTGKKDELVNVSDGYARNFLFPRGLAVAADAAAMSDLRAKTEAKEHHKAVELDKAMALASSIDGKSVKIEAKAGSAGRLFGKVTSKEVADELKKQFKVDVDKRKIEMECDIKAFGTYNAVVKVYPGVSASVKVIVCEKVN